MLMELCVLGQRFFGELQRLRTPAGLFLSMRGSSPRTVARRLDGTGVSLADISAICLTHLDHDHFSTAWAQLVHHQAEHVALLLTPIPECLHAAAITRNLALARWSSCFASASARSRRRTPSSHCPA